MSAEVADPMQVVPAAAPKKLKKPKKGADAAPIAPAAAPIGLTDAKVKKPKKKGTKASRLDRAMRKNPVKDAHMKKMVKAIIEEICGPERTPRIRTEALNLLQQLVADHIAHPIRLANDIRANAGEKTILPRHWRPAENALKGLPRDVHV